MCVLSPNQTYSKNSLFNISLKNLTVPIEQKSSSFVLFLWWSFYSELTSHPIRKNKQPQSNKWGSDIDSVHFRKCNLGCDYEMMKVKMEVNMIEGKENDSYTEREMESERKKWKVADIQ